MARGRSKTTVPPAIGDGRATVADITTGGETTGANADGISGAFDPGSIGNGEGGNSGDADTPRTKRAYTKRNSGGGKATASLDLGITSTLLFTIHAMLATQTKCPELVLSDVEADQLAQKITAIQKTFDVVVSERTKAVVELAICGATIYGSRAVQIAIRKKAERAKIINA